MAVQTEHDTDNTAVNSRQFMEYMENDSFFPDGLLGICCKWLLALGDIGVVLPSKSLTWDISDVLKNNISLRIIAA